MDGWQQPRLEIDPQSVRRFTRTSLILVSIIVVGTIILSMVNPYTSYLWFTYDVGHPEVFSTGYRAKGLLLLLAFFSTWAFLYFNLRQALKLSLVYLDRPQTGGQRAISQTMQWVQDRGQSVLLYAAPLFSFLMALGFSNEWQTYLQWLNRVPFGIRDPMFGLDAGFYVFTLPWFRSISNYLFVVFAITAALCVVLYIGLQSLALLGRLELSQPKFRIHISALIMLALVALAGQLWLKSYEFPLAELGQFTGAGYVESQEVVIQRVLAVFLAAVGVGTLLRANRGKSYAVPMAGGITFAVLWAIGLWMYPAIIQRLLVDPNLLSVQGPYAARAIAMTRFAYGLDKIDARDMDVAARPSAEAVMRSGATLDNMRLWDPTILQSALENLQAVRPYYKFEDVDIDRYSIGGKQTMVMLSPRDIDLNGVGGASQNWTNLRLRYTHGYGVAMSSVDRATQDGWPNFLIDDIPVESKEVPLTKPQIYFSDWRDALGQPSSEYALVDTGVKELDYESTATGAVTHEWEGKGGVPISGLLSRLAFSLLLADGNLLVSPNINGGARILIRRNVLERANAVYPFLKFDSDPYLVVLDGRLIWMLDGYSVSNNMPYSSRMFGANYIRNSVKATVDAYTGDISAYAVLPDEPILRVNRRIYPGLIKDLDEMPEGLKAHFRYPEDMLQMQAITLQTYHITDPTTFLSNSDAWNIASERDVNGSKARIRPYYVQMQLPDEPKDAFLQILPFTPNGRPNMSGWLAAHCDPEDYGKLTLYRFVGSNPALGPEQMESKFNSWPQISDINRQFNNDQSEVVPGNLLVVPIGDSVMYVEPLFLQSRSSGIQAAPRLSWVVLALRDQVVVGETYESALKQLFSNAPRNVETSGGKPAAPETSSASPTVGAREALDLLREAEAAQKAGDWAKYGELQKQLKAKLEELVGRG
jgi:uncharacterized membrane protein (UPF0182 family)